MDDSFFHPGVRVGPPIIKALPPDIQEAVESGAIPTRSAYELTKLDEPATIRRLADRIANDSLTHLQTADAVRQRRGKKRSLQRIKKLTFPTQAGWKVIVTGKKTGTYHEIEQALSEALEEVRTRINNNVTLI